MSKSDIPALPDRTTIILRGIRERCPKCGIGKLFVSYLKPVQTCPACGEDLSMIRADDGPAWLTVIVTGHFVIPISIYLSMHDLIYQGLALTLLLLSTVGMVLLLLPRAKGVFIGMLWLLRQKRHDTGSRWDSIAKIP